MSGKPTITTVPQISSSNEISEATLKESVIEILSTRFKRSQLQEVELPTTTATTSADQQRNSLFGISVSRTKSFFSMNNSLLHKQSSLRPKFRRSGTNKGNFLNSQQVDTVRSGLLNVQLSQLKLTEIKDPRGESSIQVPEFFKHVTDRLLTLKDTEGIFRVAGSAQREKVLLTKLAKRDYNFEGVPAVDLSAITKRFLRSIPGGLIPDRIRSLMVEASYLLQVKQSRVPRKDKSQVNYPPMKRGRFASRIRARSPATKGRPSDGNISLYEPPSSTAYEEIMVKDTIETILLLCLLIPKLNRDLLIYTLNFLLEISKAEEKNRMSLANLIIVFAPTLFPQDLSTHNRTLSHRVFKRVTKSLLYPDPLKDSLNTKQMSGFDSCLGKESKVLEMLFQNVTLIGSITCSVHAKAKELDAKKLASKKHKMLTTVMSNITSGFNRMRRRSRSTAVQTRDTMMSPSSFIRPQLKGASSQSINFMSVKGFSEVPPLRPPRPIPQALFSTKQIPVAAGNIVGSTTVNVVLKVMPRVNSNEFKNEKVLDTALLLDADDAPFENIPPPPPAAAAAAAVPPAPIAPASPPVQQIQPSLKRRSAHDEFTDVEDRLRPVKRPSFCKTEKKKEEEASMNELRVMKKPEIKTEPRTISNERTIANVSSAVATPLQNKQITHEPISTSLRPRRQTPVARSSQRRLRTRQNIDGSTILRSEIVRQTVTHLRSNDTAAAPASETTTRNERRLRRYEQPIETTRLLRSYCRATGGALSRTPPRIRISTLNPTLHSLSSTHDSLMPTASNGGGSSRRRRRPVTRTNMDGTFEPRRRRQTRRRRAAAES